MMMYSYSVVFALLASTVVSQDVVSSSPTRRYLRAFSRRVPTGSEPPMVDGIEGPYRPPPPSFFPPSDEPPMVGHGEEKGGAASVAM